jgi:phenylacetate-CoA ligase
MDEIMIQVEAAAAVRAEGEAALERFRGSVAEELQRMLGIRARIVVGAEQSIPRTDFKARRVIDDREVFRRFADKLGEAS